MDKQNHWESNHLSDTHQPVKVTSIPVAPAVSLGCYQNPQKPQYFGFCTKKW